MTKRLGRELTPEEVGMLVLCGGKETQDFVIAPSARVAIDTIGEEARPLEDPYVRRFIQKELLYEERAWIIEVDPEQPDKQAD